MNAFADQSTRTWNSDGADLLSPREAERIKSIGEFTSVASNGLPPSSFDLEANTRYSGPARNWYTMFVYPLLRRIEDPENANQLAKVALELLHPLLRDTKPDAPSLAVSAFGQTLKNPIGIAAGWDKDADRFGLVLDAGFGFLEIGTVTPRPQIGNPRPRVVRLPEDGAIINRMGFPSGGLAHVLPRLKSRPNRGVIGANFGANKDSTDRAADYVECAKALAPLADYLVCNVSSPNTPGLRSLQGRKQLSDLLKRVQDAIAGCRAPLLVKISPDASDDDLDDIVAVSRDLEIGGLIVGNTTLSRPKNLLSTRRTETGGLSGHPLNALSTNVLLRTARRVEGHFPLIGCGGVASGADAYAKIRAGATLVQLYTAWVYEGPPLIRRIKDELAALLARDGFASVTAAIGADLR